MTLAKNGRVAGAVLILYIATGIADMIVSGRVIRGSDTAAKLASIAQHLPEMRVAILLTMLQIFYALILGVTLYALTRDADRDLALLALTCRAGEGLVAAIPTIVKFALLSVATAAASAAAPDAEALRATAAVLLKLRGSTTVVGATLFAVGSALFSWLFLRARSIPAPLAWLGVIASGALVITIPLEGFRLIGGIAAWLVWVPMLVFEIALALLLLTRGVRGPVSSVHDN